MRYEWNFLDGPGRDKVILRDEAPKVLFLCNRRNQRWWTYHEPEERIWIEATYDRLGNAPRLEGPTLILYGVTDEVRRADPAYAETGEGDRGDLLRPGAPSAGGGTAPETPD